MSRFGYRFRSAAVPTVVGSPALLLGTVASVWPRAVPHGENVYYDTVSRGFISLGEFIPSADLFKEVPGSWKDLAYPNLKNTDGS